MEAAPIGRVQFLPQRGVHRDPDGRAGLGLRDLDHAVFNRTPSHRQHVGLALAGVERQAVERVAESFSGGAAASKTAREAEFAKSHAKIGELVVERDFLPKAVGR